MPAFTNAVDLVSNNCQPVGLRTDIKYTLVQCPFQTIENTGTTREESALMSPLAEDHPKMVTKVGLTPKAPGSLSGVLSTTLS